MAVYTSINDPSVHFQTTLYTGNGNASSRAITNTGNSDLQPDWLWIKSRSVADNGVILDSSRGVTKQVKSNGNDSEDTVSHVASFNTDGFNLTSTDQAYNGNSATYAAWQWKSNGGTTASNSNGSITSTVQVNTTAGFSIILYTATGSNATIGHGLSQSPELIITKGRSDNHSWIVGCTHDSSDLSKVLVMNSNAASATSTGNYQGVAPTSTVYSIGTSGGNNSTGGGGLYVAYAFHSVQGYSNFGTYEGNGDTDGPFVYTGFKPAYVLIKRTDSTGNWYIYDTQRNGSSGPNTNQAHKILYANDSSGEVDNSSRGIDMISHGFKVRNTLGDTNADGGAYMYWSFASSPFVSSAGVPTTAR